MVYMVIFFCLILIFFEFPSLSGTLIILFTVSEPGNSELLSYFPDDVCTEPDSSV